MLVTKQKVLRRFWYATWPIDKLRDGPKPFTLLGEDIVLFLDQDNFLAPEHVDEILRIVSAELELLAVDGVTDRELAVAKGNLRAEMLLSGEDSGARMSRLGASLLLHGEVLSVDEVLARIDGIDPGQVLDVAAELAQAPRTMSAVGPFERRDFESHLPAMVAR